MAVDLTTIFGSEICVYAQPRLIERQYVGFTGGHGVVGMHLGTRGRALVITGTLRASGANYAAARANLQAVIDAIESYEWAPAADYSFCGVTYPMVVWDKFELAAESEGKVFHWAAPGYCVCRFVCHGRSLY